jgi:hypothetical protein
MAGRLQIEPITISHGLLNCIRSRLPSATWILGYINHSTPAHLPSVADVDSEFNSPVELANDVVRIKNPFCRPAYGNISWATLLLNKTNVQIQFIREESGFLRLQNSSFQWNLAQVRQIRHCQRLTLIILMIDSMRHATWSIIKRVSKSRI